mmetsp:Transcript_31579/g.54066  ORF Transcript_31579/g.54066 Transcript_31579/m.54066 type:complete len:122 (+) Transcript_31579:28-393(+)
MNNLLRLGTASRISLVSNGLRFYSVQEQLPSLDKHRRKLLYQSKQRGMKETCILIGGFAEKHLSTLSEEQLKNYEKVLDEIDPSIYEWITDTKPIPDHLDKEIMTMMKEYANNNPLNYKIV